LLKTYSYKQKQSEMLTPSIFKNHLKICFYNIWFKFSYSFCCFIYLIP